MEEKQLYLSEAMLLMNKKFHRRVLNIMNSHAGSGKTSFIFDDFLNNSFKYIEGIRNNYSYKYDLNKVLYVCDTNMLKSAVISHKDCITKILSKGDLKEAMDNKNIEDYLEGDFGYIKVITYSTLGWLLKNEASRHIIINYISLIIMDEMHNLFKYSKRFDTEENRPYGTVIDYLPTLVSNGLVIALTATEGRIYNGVRDKGINTNTIFTNDELEQIRKFKHIEHHTHHMMNEIKHIAINRDWFIEKKEYKIFIYTNTITQSQKYKEFLEGAGYSVEWLCSINNTTANEEGERIPTMNLRQLSIRERLIKVGTLPDNLDVLIVNSGYETGWDLKDPRVQFVYIDSTDYDTQIQARNRVRHDILMLTTKVRIDWDGTILEYDLYRNDIRTDESFGSSSLARYIEDKYIGIKLKAEDKKYLINKYAMKQYNENDVNWKTFKVDLELAGFIVKTYKNGGTYIFKKGQEIKKDVKTMEKKQNAEDIIKDYMNVKLFLDKQEELQDKLISMKVKTNGKGTLGKKMVQNIVEDCGLVFISKQETKGEYRKKTYWYITEIKIA